MRSRVVLLLFPLISSLLSAQILTVGSGVASETPAQLTDSAMIATVQGAYAKLRFSAQLTPLAEMLPDIMQETTGGRTTKPVSIALLNQKIEQHTVTFELSDFKIGNISDISNARASEFMTPAVGGEMLMLNSESYMFNLGMEINQIEGLKPKWVPAPEESIGNMTIGELRDRQWQGSQGPRQWERYVSYTATVSFQGKTRGPYKALFVFGHDPKGNILITPEDAITFGVALADSLSVSLFPRVLLHTAIREHPVVVDWLNAHERAGVSCDQDRSGVCFDPVTLECYLGGMDVQREFAKPLLPLN